ncbi:hypothetical protein Lal_00044100 [Lupinus albus]|uniref:Putative QWRF family protein n=1 Tax=Lupinus albus TaxID=3870 RepID=A0A6A5PFJ0_LUPAL|nr:putative QWRF family protein [Lupinus albus]KAF1895450.1 hypothetical protein Lal_00044100 [Lupinus albus]
MLQLCPNMSQQNQPITVSQNPISETRVSVSPPPPPPPPPPLPPTPSNNRRPRVREVSSRFMSPAVSTVQRRRHHHSEEDENNKPIENSETPFPIGNSSSLCKPSVGPTNQRKQRSVKLFKENNGIGRVEHVPPPHPSKSCSGRIGIGVNNGFATPSCRPDTPTITISSRYRITQQHRSSSNMSGNASAATKLLQASGMFSSSNSNNHQLKLNSSTSALSQLETNSDTGSVYSNDECRDSDISCSIQSLPELCSEGDVLPSVSTRSVVEKISNKGSMSNNSTSSGELKFHTPLSRSINLPSHSGSGHLLVHSVKGSEKQQGCSLSKQCGNQPNHVKVGGLSLPPIPPCAKQVIDTRRGKKGSSHQEDLHSMRLLYNRYLQWRFANAKAKATMKVQQRESEKALYSLAMKLSELRGSVNMKRLELGVLQRLQTLLQILEAQIPYLDEWSDLEEDYSVFITETIQALLNASAQLPTGENVRVDVREMKEALSSALKMMDTIVSHIQIFMPRAEETDISISELARVAGGERALIGECGDLLSKTHKSQVEECSLRGQIIQLHSICHKNTEQEITDNSIATSPHK